MKYRFYTADVFTDRRFGGNPLAVFPNAEGLTPEQMQQISREFNLSETVFVLPPETSSGTRRLRIFTPGTELPFAGHPTVGTAYVLATIGEILLTDPETQIIFEEGVGPVPVVIRSHGNQPIFSQLSAAKMPEFGPPPPPVTELAEMLQLDSSGLLNGALAPQAVSCGVPFLCIPVTDCSTLAQAKLNIPHWETLLANYWAPHVYLLTLDSHHGKANVRVRMFAPAMGITEDPATGAAATVLAGYLCARNPLQDGTLNWTVEQGIEIHRPSLLEVEADKQGGKIVGIRVAGRSVLISEGLIEVD